MSQMHKPILRTAWVLGTILMVTGGIKTVALAQSGEEALKAFEAVRSVIQSPRCLNCHVPGNTPHQGDQGKLHAIKVRRGEDGRGSPAMRCINCHGDANETIPNGPPGVPDWHMPPPSRTMVFLNLPAGELCNNLKDPSKNGGKNGAQLVEHVSKDRLVLWGWNPGPGRTTPPLSHKEFTEAFSRWVAGGMPCP